MGKNIIVYDIETKYLFDEVGGRDNLRELGISVLGSFDYKTGEYVIYEENQLSAFEDRLKFKPVLVGFNSKKFDTPILQRYCTMSLSQLPQVDIMEEMQKRLGHRVSLDSVAKATLHIGKSGSGLDAIKYYRSGEMDKLKKYCLDDVRITKEVFEYGAKHKELLYTDKYNGSNRHCEVAWEIAHPSEREVDEAQGTLF
ncbi:MAG: ribonuclease H-like domain-containing protein [Pseudomonadota bacterium]